MKFEETQLWKLFLQKANGNYQLISDLNNFCSAGETLSSTIIHFFPTFTKHDATHIEGVCNWMIQLLGNHYNDLTLEENMLLLMAACWHDSGMSVTEEEKAELKRRLEDGAPNWNDDLEWKTYFKKHPGDAVAYHNDHDSFERILRSFIRENHHNRAAKRIDTQTWSTEFTSKGINSQILSNLCKSHCEKLKVYSQSSKNYDLCLCQVLLRLADILDYDASRAPDTLFRHLGLDHPQSPEEEKSSEEFKKNFAGRFRLENDNKSLCYSAQCFDPNIEDGIKQYLKWVEEELYQCRIFLSSNSIRWNDLQIPFAEEPDIDSKKYYEKGDFRLTMDQDRIIELLAGENLYSDPGVFVRELLQNAIDAVLDRVRCEKEFNLGKAKINIYTWCDESNIWFRIEDNGTGMDEHIIHNYFLKVGCSYYTSDEYKVTEIDPTKDTGFKPTSRFGIGILSCFMSDTKHNQVEVETWRYSDSHPNPNEVLRLFIPKLHGSYYLIKNNTLGKNITNPPQDKDWSRKEPGTTICVRVNRYRMGTNSFREILDKYINFPEVKITHYDLDANSKKTYISLSEFTELIEQLHGDNDKPRQHVFSLPQQYYEELKKQIPEFKLDIESIKLITHYQRCNSLSNNMSGMIWDIKTNIKHQIQKNDNENVHIIAKLKCNVSFDGPDLILLFTLLLREYDKNHSHNSKNKKSTHRKETILKIPLAEIYSSFSTEEQKLLEYMSDYAKSNNIIAYNGILAANSISSNDSRYLLLLRGKNYPIVDIAREGIRSLPIEATCELGILIRPYQNIHSQFSKIQNELMPETKYIDILKQNPTWEKQLRYKLKNNKRKNKELSIPEIEDLLKSNEKCIISLRQSTYDYNLLCLTALKLHFSVGTTSSIKNAYIISLPSQDETNTEENFASFPPQLFINDKNQYSKKSNNNIFCIKNIYNPSHRFSKWLLSHQTELIDKWPEQYNLLLRAMCNFKLEDINKEINILKKIDGLSLDISDELILSTNDFDYNKWIE